MQEIHRPNEAVCPRSDPSDTQLPKFQSRQLEAAFHRHSQGAERMECRAEQHTISYKKTVSICCPVNLSRIELFYTFQLNFN